MGSCLFPNNKTTNKENLKLNNCKNKDGNNNINIHINENSIHDIEIEIKKKKCIKIKMKSNEYIEKVEVNHDMVDNLINNNISLDPNFEENDMDSHAINKYNSKFETTKNMLESKRFDQKLEQKFDSCSDRSSFVSELSDLSCIRFIQNETIELIDTNTKKYSIDRNSLTIKEVIKLKTLTEKNHKEKEKNISKFKKN